MREASPDAQVPQRPQRHRDHVCCREEPQRPGDAEIGLFEQHAGQRGEGAGHDGRDDADGGLVAGMAVMAVSLLLFI